MKLTTGILVLGLAAGTAGGQNPSIIDSTRAKLNAVQQQKTADSNAAVAATQGQTVAPHAVTTQAPAKPAVAPMAKPAPGKTATSGPMPVAHTSTAQTAGKQKSVTATPMAPKTAAKAVAAKTKVKSTAVVVKKPAEAKVAVEDKKNPVEPKKAEPKAVNMAGRRDPFLSPVVNRSAVGSGCTTGKRCLAIDQVSLTGIVKADTGMIAVVVNALNKAYFLRENDPVFNGYVVRITGDSIIFKETVEDKVGKPFTREVTKKITTPAV